ncbi:MAG TPA: cytochrome c oxidase subunit 3 family protein [Polyangia bacterium]|nr:cytochrome c oxidase subunit 3 family protein [Polyangia bacterium]
MPDTHVHRAHHFQDLGKQVHAERLGMWLFLGTEVLLFAGLFVGYSFYRTLYPHAFAEASHHLDTPFGTLETFDLITSSLAMALGIHFTRTGRRRLSVAAVALTILMGLAFLGMHSVEYRHEYLEGMLPGQYYHFAELPLAGASLFFTMYFLMTGLHSLHVIAGVGVLTYLCVRTYRGAYSPAYQTPLELGGLYWHLVDMIWIFLYPLLYLI